MSELMARGTRPASGSTAPPVVRVTRDGDRARVHAAGALTLANAMAMAEALADAEPTLRGCRVVELDLGSAVDVDGAGAVLLARLLDRLEATGCGTGLVGGAREAERQVALYRERHVARPSVSLDSPGALARLGAYAAHLPDVAAAALDFTGRFVAAVPSSLWNPRSADWRSLPRLAQAIGADGLPVAAAANLLVGLIVGFIGVSQLGRFGAVVYVPELVVVAHFRELGPLVTAIVVAGRSGAGLASEIATMKVSEEIDALRSLGFDPVRWLVVPRCVALVLTVPVLAWVGDVLALAGAMAATLLLTDMSPRAFMVGTADAITASHFLTGLIKTPFLALAIGLIACGQGLATVGGAAAVGTRTTTAVVLSIFSAIVISAVFTCLFVLLGV
jgi:phospholipid/cholesterol/gamma-HCH transport system permease protein